MFLDRDCFLENSLNAGFSIVENWVVNKSDGFDIAFVVDVSVNGRKERAVFVAGVGGCFMYEVENDFVLDGKTDFEKRKFFHSVDNGNVKRSCFILGYDGSFIEEEKTVLVKNAVLMVFEEKPLFGFVVDGVFNVFFFDGSRIIEKHIKLCEEKPNEKNILCLRLHDVLDVMEKQGFVDIEDDVLKLKFEKALEV